MNEIDTIQNQNSKQIRPWGYYVNIAKGEGFLTKIIHVNSKEKLSVQSHNHRKEHWFIIKGTAKVLLNSETYTLNSGDSIDIPIQAIHSIYNPLEDDLELIEIQMGKILSEKDIIRYEDIYGRV